MKRPLNQGDEEWLKDEIRQAKKFYLATLEDEGQESADRWLVRETQEPNALRLFAGDSELAKRYIIELRGTCH